MVSRNGDLWISMWYYIYIKIDISLPKIEALHSLAIGVTAALVIYFDK